jgi:hypothetical protein
MTTAQWNTKGIPYCPEDWAPDRTTTEELVSADDATLVDDVLQLETVADTAPGPTITATGKVRLQNGAMPNQGGTHTEQSLAALRPGPAVVDVTILTTAPFCPTRTGTAGHT